MQPRIEQCVHVRKTYFTALNEAHLEQVNEYGQICCNLEVWSISPPEYKQISKCMQDLNHILHDVCASEALLQE